MYTFVVLSVMMIGSRIGVGLVGVLLGGGGVFVENVCTFWILYNPVVLVVLIGLLTPGFYFWSPSDAVGEPVVASTVQWYLWTFDVALLYQCHFSLYLYEIFPQVFQCCRMPRRKLLYVLIYLSDCICEVMCSFHCAIHWGFSGFITMGWVYDCLYRCAETVCF